MMKSMSSRARLDLPFIVATAVAMVTMHCPMRAAACVWPGAPHALVGRPIDGEMDVPTDVVPYYDALAAGIDINQLASSAAKFVLVAPSGDEIRTNVVRSHITTLEITPERQLEPQTTYTLRGTWTGQSFNAALAFTTGAGPVATLPPPPVASLQHYRFVGTGFSTCSPPQSGSCISFDADLPVEAMPFQAGRDAGFGFGPGVYLREGPFFDDLSGIMQGTPADCVRLRTRAPNGKTSEPTVLCRGDGPLVTIVGDEKIACSAKGIVYLDTGATVATDACTVGRGRPQGATAWAVAAASLVGLLRRRGGRPHRPRAGRRR
jgi:hypothetical protein